MTHNRQHILKIHNSQNYVLLDYLFYIENRNIACSQITDWTPRSSATPPSLPSPGSSPSSATSPLPGIAAARGATASLSPTIPPVSDAASGGAVNQTEGRADNQSAPLVIP